MVHGKLFVEFPMLQSKHNQLSASLTEKSGQIFDFFTHAQFVALQLAFILLLLGLEQVFVHLLDFLALTVLLGGVFLDQILVLLWWVVVVIGVGRSFFLNNTL